ncbi:MAG: TonB-dependent receptor [Deltaproteobacteria bacterium]|nr:TonB-dependent receptor [Deltaproteobacteria bacterium]
MGFNRRFAGKLALAMLSCALVPAQSAFAEDTVKAGDVFVTATRVEKELMDVPSSVTVITAEQVRHSGARTVGEVLEDVPGVQIMNDGSQGLKRVRIRGEDAFRTLVLIDGQKISEQKSMSGSPLLIDASRIERVEVIKGPASVLYGSDAIGGVINVITKKGGKKPVEGEAFVGYNGASRGFSEGASVFGKVKGLKYRFSGSHAEHDNVHTPDGTLKNTWFNQTDASAFLSYDFSERFTLGGSYDYYRGHFNSTALEYVENPNQDFFVKVPKWSREKFNAFAEARDISKWFTRLRLDAYYQKTIKHMENFVGDYTGGDTVEVDNFARNYLNTTGVSLQTDWQLGSANHLIAGYEFSFDDMDSVNRNYMKMNQMMSPVMSMKMDYYRDKLYEGNQTTHALFANMETQLPRDFALTYGVRWTYVRSELESVNAFRTGSAGMYMGSIPMMTMFDDDHKPVTDDAKVGSESYSRPVFNVGLVWTGIEDLALRASWAQGFRAPNLTEKFIGTSMGQTGGTTYGNPDLDPETSNNFEVGARWNHGPVFADLAFFYSIADDYITSRRIAETANYMYTNVSKATTFGSELSASYKLDTSWGMFQPYMALTWMRREYDYGDGFKTYDSGTPEWFSRYGVRYRKSINNYITLRSDAYGRSQTATKTAYSDGTSDKIGGFTTANFSLGLDFGKNREFSLDAEVLNIFDKRYQYNYAILEPGVHANVRLGCKF